MKKAAHYEAKNRTHSKDSDISTILVAVTASIPQLCKLNDILDRAAGVRGDRAALGKVRGYMKAREHAGVMALRALLAPNSDTVFAVIDTARHLSELGLEVLKLLESDCFEILDTEPEGNTSKGSGNI